MAKPSLWATLLALLAPIVDKANSVGETSDIPFQSILPTAIFDNSLFGAGQQRNDQAVGGVTGPTGRLLAENQFDDAGQRLNPLKMLQMDIAKQSAQFQQEYQNRLNSALEQLMNAKQKQLEEMVQAQQQNQQAPSQRPLYDLHPSNRYMDTGNLNSEWRMKIMKVLLEQNEKQKQEENLRRMEVLNNALAQRGWKEKIRWEKFAFFEFWNLNIYFAFKFYR